MILCVCPNPSVDTYAWIDDLTPGVNRISKQEEFPGGKGIHVALAIEELGAEANVLCFWAGSTGAWINNECSRKSIICYGVDVDGANRKCYTFRTIEHGNQEWNNSELIEIGPSISSSDYDRFLALFKVRMEEANLICLSGSWPVEAPIGAYHDLIAIANTGGKRVILDASGLELEYALKAKPFGLHLNMEEAKNLCSTEDVNSILSFLGKSVQLVALTKGKEGLFLMYQGQVLHAHLEIPQVLSTVGSGDCLTAGISYAVEQNMDIYDIARIGVTCGAANCLRDDLGMLYKEDVNKLINQVTIKEIFQL